MDEPFELPVFYKGEEHFFTSQLQQSGYTHKIIVNIHGTEVAFEPDEERNYRALIDPEKMDKDIQIDLLKAIAESIEQIVK